MKSSIQRIIVERSANATGDEARILYFALPSMPRWRHYYSVDHPDLEDWAEKFLNEHSLMPGILDTRVHFEVPAKLFECEIDGPYYKGALYLNGCIVITDGGDVEVHIENDEANRFGYPASRFHLNGRWYGDKEEEE